MKNRRWGWLLLLGLLGSSAFADPRSGDKASVIPVGLDFVRSIEVEGFVQERSYNGTGAQSGRVETRYLDPDVNAFVGMLAQYNNFNEKIPLIDPNNPSFTNYLVTWGVDFGIVRGRHMWELDVMGTNVESHLGFAPAIVGEHRLWKPLALYHRSTLNFYTGDTVIDSDQGFRLSFARDWGLTLGYRILCSMHSNRNGPRAGIVYRFQGPRIPFIFPSIG